MQKVIVGVAILVSAACGVARAGGDDAAKDAPRAESLSVNQPVTGLCAMAQADGEAAVGGKMVFQLSLSNAGPQAVELRTARESSAWLIIGGGKGNACFTEKIRLEPEGSGWPPEMAPAGVLRFKPFDAGAATAYPFDRSLKFADGYLATATGGLPVAAGRLKDILSSGKTKAKWTIAIPQGTGSPPMFLWTAPLEVVVGPPHLAEISPDARRSYVADLLKRFDRDAWSAKEAHDEAVKLGPEILPDMIAAAQERQRPEHARLWLATAVADIPDERAVAALTGLLDDPQGGVRCVVAYHGPKQKSDTLDRAIIGKSKTGGDAAFTSYALLGLMVSRSRVSDDLMQAGLGNADPKVRAAAAKALAGMATDRNRSRLQALLKDPDEHVRAAAQKVLNALNAEDGRATSP